ncbi:MAG: hypothetical protein IPP62_13470 [bacterium]|nr:hypothetical protein [bacterium]
MIRLRILGAGGAVPTPTHTPAAYWVTVDGISLLLDIGPGALVRLVRSGDAPGGVDDIHTVLLTHLHPTTPATSWPCSSPCIRRCRPPTRRCACSARRACKGCSGNWARSTVPGWCRASARWK